jgi:hypothetical protein
MAGGPAHIRPRNTQQAAPIYRAGVQRESTSLTTAWQARRRTRRSHANPLAFSDRNPRIRARCPIIASRLSRCRGRHRSNLNFRRCAHHRLSSNFRRCGRFGWCLHRCHGWCCRCDFLRRCLRDRSCRRRLTLALRPWRQPGFHCRRVLPYCCQHDQPFHHDCPRRRREQPLSRHRGQANRCGTHARDHDPDHAADRCQHNRRSS